MRPRPDAVLKYFTSDFTSTIQYLGNAPKKRDHATWEKETRAHFPGTPQGPASVFYPRSFKSSGPNVVTVELWVYSITPRVGTDPESGNSDGSYSVTQRWVKQTTWKLQQEEAKAVEQFPSDPKNAIQAKKP